MKVKWLYREATFTALCNARAKWNFRCIYIFENELRKKYGLEMSRLYLN